MALLEVKQTPDGKILARRKDGLALTPEDREEARKMIQTEEDPLLSPDQWYPEFHRLHVQIAQESPDFDRLWLKQYRPDLYVSLKTKENEIDALQEARLSQVVAIMREWRELIRKAEFEQREAHERA